MNKLEIELMDKGPLSNAESRVLCQWLTGDLHKVCASRLEISTRTLEAHIDRIKAKLEARSEVVALKEAEHRGMVRSRLVRLQCPDRRL